MLWQKKRGRRAVLERMFRLKVLIDHYNAVGWKKEDDVIECNMKRFCEEQKASKRVKIFLLGLIGRSPIYIGDDRELFLETFGGFLTWDASRTWSGTPRSTLGRSIDAGRTESCSITATLLICSREPRSGPITQRRDFCRDQNDEKEKAHGAQAQEHAEIQ
jgi:hypothetical protein